MDFEKIYAKLPDSIKYNNYILDFFLKIPKKLQNLNKKSNQLNSQNQLLDLLFTSCDIKIKGNLRNVQLLYIELLRFVDNVCKKHDIDYSEDLIEIAKENYNYDNCHFQVLSASQLDTADLLVSAPFDIVIITGVLIYFNDDTIKKMIKDLNSLCASNKTIYIRETLSFLETRLTLKDFFSENLEADYNAIYRTDDEFLDFIKGINGNITIETGEIFDELKNFTETGYKYFLIKSVN